MGGGFEKPDLSEFALLCTKRFCPWCGQGIQENRIGRRRKFCCDKCRWAFWKFETRHKDIKTQIEKEISHENSRAEGSSGRTS